MQDFETKEALVKSFKKIKLPRLKVEPRTFWRDRGKRPLQKLAVFSQSSSVGDPATSSEARVAPGSSESSGSSSSCFYCEMDGHTKFMGPELSKDCPRKMEGHVHNVDQLSSDVDE